MAFESQRKSSIRRGFGRGDGKPRISLRLTTGGSTGAHLTKATGLQGETVDIEIDEDTQKLRVGLCDDGYRVSEVGAFSLSKRTFRIISPNSITTKKIELIKGNDGWWYGSYGEKA